MTISPSGTLEALQRSIASVPPASRSLSVASLNVDRLLKARLYMAAIFAIIIASGLCGIAALERSQQSSELAARNFERASDAVEMAAALDREVAGYFTLVRRREGNAPRSLHEATHAFYLALTEIRRDGWASEGPTLNALAATHATFLKASRAMLAATTDGNYARSARIEAGVRLHVREMHFELDELSMKLFRAGMGEHATDRLFSQRLERVLAAVTLAAVGLMIGVVLLLRISRRSALAAADAMVCALEQVALTDNLTKLGNHRAFHSDLAREVARAKRHGHPCVLALIDIDEFKAVNERGGHAHGDQVLALVGERLRALRQEDRAYRIGGDEFALILVDTGPEAARTVLARLQDEARMFLLGATLSIGYIDCSGERLGQESYELADAALYAAKRNGRNRTMCFDDLSGAANVFSPDKAAMVRTMIADELVTSAFQPIWDVDSTRPLGFEALARPHADLGLAGPQEAFDIAERIRLLPQLDRVCTRKALEAASSNLPGGSVIFLNYSPASLAHADFDTAEFVAVVRAAGLVPEQIVVEITERRIDDIETMVARVAALRAVGVRVALDDVGSGHAALQLLSRLRLDFVKIDRELVCKAIDNREARGVLSGLIAIARETGSYLIAEGIETRQMLEFICKAHLAKTSAFVGIRGIQGYLLGRPQTDRIDVRSLEESQDYLASLALDGRPAPSSIPAISGDSEQAGRARRFAAIP